MSIYTQRLEHIFMRISQISGAQDPTLRRFSNMVTQVARILAQARELVLASGGPAPSVRSVHWSARNSTWAWKSPLVQYCPDYFRSVTANLFAIQLVSRQVLYNRVKCWNALIRLDRFFVYSWHATRTSIQHSPYQQAFSYSFLASTFLSLT